MKHNKKAFSLFELIIVIFLSSIVLIYTFNFAKELFEVQNTNEKIASLKLDLNSAKIIIRKNLPNAKEQLSFDGDTLFLNGKILLKNITKYEQKYSSNILSINITLEDSISQVWQFKL